MRLKKLSAADFGRLEDDEDGIYKDAKDGCKDDGRDAIGEQEWDLKGEDAVRQCQISADAADENDRANRKLFRVEEIDLLRLDQPGMRRRFYRHFYLRY